MTIGKLRLFVACVWRGKPGVAIVSRPVLKSDELRPEQLREVCWAFWDAMHSEGEPLIRAFEDRKRTVIGTPAVIAALGAIAHDCAGGKGLPHADDRDTLLANLRQAVIALKTVGWGRTEAWTGLCGRMLPGKEHGAPARFRVGGGAKDSIHEVFRTLRDPNSEAYPRVRGTRAGQAVSALAGQTIQGEE